MQGGTIKFLSTSLWIGWQFHYERGHTPSHNYSHVVQVNFDGGRRGDYIVKRFNFGPPDPKFKPVSSTSSQIIFVQLTWQVLSQGLYQPSKLWHQSQNLLFTWQQYTVHEHNFPLKALEIKVALSGTFIWTCSNLDFALLALSDCKGRPGLESQERLKYQGYFATLLELVASCTVLQELLGLWSDFEHAVPYDVRHTQTHLTFHCPYSLSQP